MRLCSIALTLVLAHAAAASAQGRPAAVGVKAGVNLADLNFEAEDISLSFDSRTGFVGGLFVVWPADSRVALQAEGLFSQKGAKVSEEGASGKVKLDYFDVPVLARFSSPVSGGTSFNVFAGPSFGFKLSAKTKGGFDGEEEESMDIDDEIEGFDIGFVAGAGLEFGRFVLDGRYTWGLTDIDKDKTDEVKIKNRVFSIMAGIRF